MHLHEANESQNRHQGEVIAGVQLGLMQKDVRIACDLAGRKELTPDFLLNTHNLWNEALANLGPQRPVTEMARYSAERIRTRKE